MNDPAVPLRDLTPMRPAGRPHVVIVGAGFGGLACAQALGGRDVQVTIVDRQNYHLFVPLLYQVATAALSPADIAEPIRKALRRYPNVGVVMANVTGVEVAARRVLTAAGGYLPFDRLVLATGSRYNYFGHDDWAARAPGLKTVADARRIRADILLGFEQAEICKDPDEQSALTTSVIVGAGPTGVEMAGAIAELARWSLRRNFRNVDPAAARVVLIEAGPRILAAFPERLAAYALAQLRKMGVTVLTDTIVEDIGEDGVTVAGERIRAKTVVWAAGTSASPAAQWLAAKGDRFGRIPVEADLSVPGLAGIFAIGDTALARDAQGGALPALAQVAKQQGRHLGLGLADELERRTPLTPFRFKNRGNTAVIGRNAAVFDFGWQQLKGRAAWFLWALIHVYLLVAFEKRLLVSMQWFWRWLTHQRGARLISWDEARDAPSER
jgi:NADH dehydrogenase